MDRRSKLMKYGVWNIILDVLFALEAIVNICSGKGTGLDYVMLTIAGSLLLLTVVYYWTHKGNEKAEESSGTEKTDDTKDTMSDSNS